MKKIILILFASFALFSCKENGPEIDPEFPVEIAINDIFSQNNWYTTDSIIDYDGIKRQFILYFGAERRHYDDSGTNFDRLNKGLLDIVGTSELKDKSIHYEANYIYNNTHIKITNVKQTFRGNGGILEGPTPIESIPFLGQKPEYNYSNENNILTINNIEFTNKSPN